MNNTENQDLINILFNIEELMHKCDYSTAYKQLIIAIVRYGPVHAADHLIYIQNKRSERIYQDD